MTLDINNLPQQVLERYKDRSGHPSQETDPAPQPAPGTSWWFEWKVRHILTELHERFFGYAFYIEMRRKKTSKRIQRNMSQQALVSELSAFEKHLERRKNVMITGVFHPLDFLKQVLEQNAPLFGFEEELFTPLGIKRDRSDMTQPEANAISFQAVAQALWYEEGKNIPTKQAMLRKMRNEKEPWASLLGIKRFHSDRNIEKWIDHVFPIPAKVRKNRRILGPEDFQTIRPIPALRSVNGINFQKVRWATEYITLAFHLLGWPADRIIESPPVKLLAELVGSHLDSFVFEWVRESMRKNNSIISGS